MPSWYIGGRSLLSHNGGRSFVVPVGWQSVFVPIYVWFSCLWQQDSILRIVPILPFVTARDDGVAFTENLPGLATPWSRAANLRLLTGRVRRAVAKFSLLPFLGNQV